jgi:hypothetical protein
MKLLLAGEAKWVTAPVGRPPHGVQSLADAVWADQPWRDKLLKSLQLHYGRAPFRREAMELLEPLIRNPEPRLVAYNLHAVRAIAGALRLPGNFALSSSFGVEASATERLVELVRLAGCRTYLAGGGASGYQDDALFSRAKLELQYQAFDHPAYPQCGATGFTPGMSIIDALMNCGLDRTREMVIS